MTVEKQVVPDEKAQGSLPPDMATALAANKVQARGGAGGLS